MADQQLSEGAFKRGIADAAAAIRTAAFGIAVSIIGVIFAAGALIASDGEPVSTQAAATVLFGVLAVGLTLLLVVVAQLAAAPIRQRNELRTVLGNRGVEEVNVGLALRNAHRRGNEMAQRFAARRSLGTPQRQEAEAWTDEVVGLLAAHAPEVSGEQFIAAGQGEDKTLPRLQQRVETLERLINEMP